MPKRLFHVAKPGEEQRPNSQLPRGEVMSIRKLLLAGLAALAFLALGPSPLAAKGGGQGKPPPDPEPPADPAIAYIRTGSGGKGYGDLMVANEDGTNQTVVLAKARQQIISRPCWSPDGTALVFASDIQGPAIYTIRIDGTGLTKITDVNWSPGSTPPVWSPVPAADGEYKIAFGDHPRNEDGTLAPNNDIFLVNLDGSGLQNLTNTPDVYEAFPTWAPSATRLAVWDIPNAPVDALSDIIVLDISLGTGGLEVTAQLNLTSDADVPGGPLNDTSVALPSWAKSQDKIIVRVVDSGWADLWIIDLADPANPTNLTQTAEIYESHPSWSSDDAHVVYHIGGSLYVLPADGTGSGLEIVSSGAHADWRR